MHWKGSNFQSYWATSAELLFQYHKLEKGLCMPGEKRFFGEDPVKATLSLLGKWESLGFSTEDPIYKGAIETLRAYRHRLDETPCKSGDDLGGTLDASSRLNGEPDHSLQTPIIVRQEIDPTVFPALEKLADARRSVRSFKPATVPSEIIQRAISIAQQCPSACNRQPTRIHVYTERERIDALLKLQNGNRGFGHTIPVLLLVTSEARCFFDASERNEPYLDAGLFVMSLLFALRAQGVSSCCLNWCVEPSNDTMAHKIGDIADSEKIITYIAVGYAEDGALAPRSPRRSIDQILVQH